MMTTGHNGGDSGNWATRDSSQALRVVRPDERTNPPDNRTVSASTIPQETHWRDPLA